MREIDRRSFVKTAMAAGAGAAALGLAACAPGQKQASSQATSAELPSEWTSEHDLVVVGAGGAGLAAALEASRAGASVMVLECENSHLFSNTALCGGVVMGCCSSIQKEAGVEDSVEEFKKYLDAINDGLDSQNLTHLWAEKSGETIDWLRRPERTSRSRSCTNRSRRRLRRRHETGRARRYRVRQQRSLHLRRALPAGRREGSGIRFRNACNRPLSGRNRQGVRCLRR